MADLETAADAAIVRIKEFTGEVEQAKEAFDAADQQLAHVASQLKSDWIALNEGIHLLIEKVGSSRTQLGEQIQQSVQALADLQHEVADTGAHGEEELHGAEQEIAALKDQADAAEPQVTALVQQIESVAQQLGTRAAAIEADLQQTISEAQEFVGVELVNGLMHMQEQIEDRAEAIKTELTGQAAQALDNMKADWISQVEQVEQTVEQAFTDAAEHATQTVEEALKACTEGHEEALNEVVQSVATLEAALQKLKSAVETQAGEVDQSKTSHVEALGDTGGRIERAMTSLQSVKDLLASFTFVQM